MTPNPTQSAVSKQWGAADERYDAYIRRELTDERRASWQGIFEEYRPGKPNLRILDSGCGPGFFALLLTGQGHHITGIDVAGSMITTAKSNAAAAAAGDCEFFQMDSHELEFADESFDMVIVRNATWLLHNPVAAFEQWHRVLKPGGRLAVFDGNWMHYVHDPVAMRNRCMDQERAQAAGWTPFPRSTTQEDNRIAWHLPLSYVNRPSWDIPALLTVGFSTVTVDPEIWKRIYTPLEHVLYASTKMFGIGAEK